MELLGRGVSAEEQFDILDKAALMAEHRKVMGNSYVDMLVDMEMEDVKAKLEELKRLSEGTEDQKTLAVLSLMWMVERRKEERWEEQREREEAEHREAHKKEEAGQGQGCKQELKGKREELAVLMDSRFKKAADRAWLEREGNSILEAEARYEEKKRELKEEDRARLEREGDLILEAEARHEGKRREVEEERKAKEIWNKIEDRQRLEREGDEMMEAIERHEEEKKEERIEKAVKELMEYTGEGWHQGEKEIQRTEDKKTEELMERAVAQIVEAGVECWHKMEEEKGCREADEVRKWRTNEEEQEKRNDGVASITVEGFRELEEEILVAGKRFIHEREEEEECREADELRKVLEMAKRKTREAEENTKIVEEEARKMIAAAKERAAEETMAMERVTKSEAAAMRQGERMRTTSMAADDERTWTTSAAAAADERTQATSVTAAKEEYATSTTAAEKKHATSVTAAKEEYATSTTAAEKKHATSMTAVEEKHSTSKTTAWEKQDEKTNVAVDMGHWEARNHEWSLRRDQRENWTHREEKRVKHQKES